MNSRKTHLLTRLLSLILVGLTNHASFAEDGLSVLEEPLPPPPSFSLSVPALTRVGYPATFGVSGLNPATTSYSLEWYLNSVLVQNAFYGPRRLCASPSPPPPPPLPPVYSNQFIINPVSRAHNGKTLSVVVSVIPNCNPVRLGSAATIIRPYGVCRITDGATLLFSKQTQRHSCAYSCSQTALTRPNTSCNWAGEILIPMRSPF
jgi:hypothetical protein